MTLKGLQSISQATSLGVAKESEFGETSDDESDRERCGMTTGLPCIIIIMLTRNCRSGLQDLRLCCRSAYLALKDLEISGTSKSSSWIVQVVTHSSQP